MGGFSTTPILLVGIFCVTLGAHALSTAASEIIGKRIFQNECSSKAEKLVWWNEGEIFASVGIGHFIWFPEGIKAPFEETFPALLSFFMEKGITLPGWLASNGACPWKTREEFLAKDKDPQRKELQELLTGSIPLQAMFIEMRLASALPKILSDLGATKRAHAEKQIALLQQTTEGTFALIDYLHFKGEGTAATERYQGRGWGLQQVLAQMEDHPDNTLEAFVTAARIVLEQRVKAAPAERHEEKWLPGWLARVERYRKSAT